MFDKTPTIEKLLDHDPCLARLLASDAIDNIFRWTSEEVERNTDPAETLATLFNFCALIIYTFTNHTTFKVNPKTLVEAFDLAIHGVARTDPEHNKEHH